MKRTGRMIFCLAMAVVLSAGGSLWMLKPEAKNTVNGTVQASSLKREGAGSKIAAKGAKSRGDFKIALDAGHQRYANSGTEPVGPGSSVKKMKVAGGASGTATKTPEYKRIFISVSMRMRLLLPV